ncbi:hypothetical protein N9C66_10820, partial [Akkermansiaceae bacterium]|nr:hypothetical protein [Akkermansiaceae bacterium]
MRLNLLALPLLGSSMASGALLVHYTFDNDNAENSGTLNDGTAVGGTAYADGIYGRAFQGN